MAEETKERNPNIATFTGYIKAVGDRNQSASGYAWRDIVLIEDPSAQYPTYCVVTAKHSPKSTKFDLTTSDKIALGNKVEVSYIPDGREYNGRWFSSLKLLFVNVLEDVKEISKSTPPPAAPVDDPFDSVQDEMPF